MTTPALPEDPPPPAQPIRAGRFARVRDGAGRGLESARDGWLNLWAGHRDALSLTQGFLALLFGTLLGLLVPGLAEDDFPAVLTVMLGVIAAVSVVLLLTQLGLARFRGTLYYVRLLQQYMSDFHLPSVVDKTPGYGDWKAIVRWTNNRCAEGAVTDLTSPAREIAAEIERSINDDTSSTGFHIAPNLLWPAAVAVGYNVYWPPETEVVDFPDGQQIQAESARALEEGRAAVAKPAVSWRLNTAARDTPKGLDPVPAARVHYTGPAGPARTVLITATFTGKGPTSLPSWPYEVHHQLAVFPDGGLTGESPRPVEITTQRPKAAITGLAYVHPTDVARACTAEIRRVLHTYPDAMVMLAFRVSKTSALAIGAKLAALDKVYGDPGCGNRGCSNQSCADPWSRLVPLQPDMPNKYGKYGILRVHDSQPQAAELATRFPS